MAKRKTFQVESLRNKINKFLQNSDDFQKEERRGQMMVLESVLHDTGNYNGFMYLSPRDMEKSDFGTSVGINEYASTEELVKMQRENTLFKGTDQTRVYYH